MVKKRYRPEDIIAKLRAADVLISHGTSVAETIKHLGVSESPSTGGAKSMEV